MEPNVMCEGCKGTSFRIAERAKLTVVCVNCGNHFLLADLTAKPRFGWLMKTGHWDHTTFVRAMDHMIRGGKIRFGRL